jgi:hypothetical protein
MSRTSGHIVKVMTYLLFLWLKHPELRFCQLIQNAFHLEDIYHIEDDNLVKELKLFYDGIVED